MLSVYPDTTLKTTLVYTQPTNLLAIGSGPKATQKLTIPKIIFTDPVGLLELLNAIKMIKVMISF